jgi:hypothetical protein
VRTVRIRGTLAECDQSTGGTIDECGVFRILKRRRDVTDAEAAVLK